MLWHTVLNFIKCLTEISNLRKQPQSPFYKGLWLFYKLEKLLKVIRVKIKIRYVGTFQLYKIFLDISIQENLKPSPCVHHRCKLSSISHCNYHIEDEHGFHHFYREILLKYPMTAFLNICITPLFIKKVSIS